MTQHIRKEIDDKYDELLEMEEGGEKAKISYTTERLKKLAAVVKNYMLYAFHPVKDYERISFPPHENLFPPGFPDEIKEIFDD